MWFTTRGKGGVSQFLIFSDKGGQANFYFLGEGSGPTPLFLADIICEKPLIVKSCTSLHLIYTFILLHKPTNLVDFTCPSYLHMLHLYYHMLSQTNLFQTNEPISIRSRKILQLNEEAIFSPCMQPPSACQRSPSQKWPPKWWAWSHHALAAILSPEAGLS